MVKYKYIKSKEFKVAKDNDKLSPKQKLFIDKYVAYGFNGHRAAVDAGYSEKTADVQASKMLRIPKIKNYLAERIKYVITNTDELSVQLIEKLKTIAFSDIRDVLTWEDDGSMSLIPSEFLSKDVTYTVSEVSSKPYLDKHGYPQAYAFKVKQVDKLKALEMLSKFVELYEVNKDKDSEEEATPAEKLSKKERTEKLLEIQKRLKYIKK